MSRIFESNSTQAHCNESLRLDNEFLKCKSF